MTRFEITTSPGTPAATLGKAGLKRGEVITRIDAIPADELDQWDVERRLSGEFGKQVTIEWEAGSSLKLAPLDLSGGP